MRRWFKVAVPPLDTALCAEITKGRDEIKGCAVCGAAFTPNSNRPNTATARIVRCRYAGRKRRNASGKDTSCITHLGQ